MMVSFLGLLGFPCSGQDFLARVCNPLQLGIEEAGPAGIATWKVLPQYLPKEKVGRARRVDEELIHFSHVVHVMRNPWNAIAEAAATLPAEAFDILKLGANIHSRMPATSCQNWESKVKVLTIAFPVWYDKIRELDPELMIKIETPDFDKLFKYLDLPNPYTIEQPSCLFKTDVQPVDYDVAGRLAGNEWASRVEVIKRNLKY